MANPKNKPAPTKGRRTAAKARRACNGHSPEQRRPLIAHAAKVIAGSIRTIATAKRDPRPRRNQLDACIEWKPALGTREDIAALLDDAREAFIMVDGIALPVRIFITGVSF